MICGRDLRALILALLGSSDSGISAHLLIGDRPCLPAYASRRALSSDLRSRRADFVYVTVKDLATHQDLVAVALLRVYCRHSVDCSSGALLHTLHPYVRKMTLTRFLGALFRERTCIGCHQGEATRGDLWVYCYLQRGCTAKGQPDIRTNALPFTLSHQDGNPLALAGRH